MRSKLAGTKHFVVPHIGQPLGCREIAVIFRVVNCALWLRTGEALHLSCAKTPSIGNPSMQQCVTRPLSYRIVSY